MVIDNTNKTSKIQWKSKSVNEFIKTSKLDNKESSDYSLKDLELIKDHISERLEIINNSFKNSSNSKLQEERKRLYEELEILKKEIEKEVDFDNKSLKGMGYSVFTRPLPFAEHLKEFIENSIDDSIFRVHNEAIKKLDVIINSFSKKDQLKLIKYFLDYEETDINLTLLEVLKKDSKYIKARSLEIAVATAIYIPSMILIVGSFPLLVVISMLIGMIVYSAESIRSIMKNGIKDFLNDINGNDIKDFILFPFRSFYFVLTLPYALYKGLFINKFFNYTRNIKSQYFDKYIKSKSIKSILKNSYNPFISSLNIIYKKNILIQSWEKRWEYTFDSMFSFRHTIYSSLKGKYIYEVLDKLKDYKTSKETSISIENLIYFKYRSYYESNFKSALIKEIINLLYTSKYFNAKNLQERNELLKNDYSNGIINTITISIKTNNNEELKTQVILKANDIDSIIKNIVNTYPKHKRVADKYSKLRKEYKEVEEKIRLESQLNKPDAKSLNKKADRIEANLMHTDSIKIIELIKEKNSKKFTSSASSMKEGIKSSNNRKSVKSPSHPHFAKGTF